MVVNCGGMWGYEVGWMVGVNVLFYVCEYFYIVIEQIDGLGQLLVLCVLDECVYYKEDVGKMLFGVFEFNVKLWGMNGILDQFEFDQLFEDFDYFELILVVVVECMLMLVEVGIYMFFNGLESFMFDDVYYFGLVLELENFWVVVGFNLIGI